MAGLQMDRGQRGLLPRWLSALLVFSVLASSCRSAPSFSPKSTWREDEDSLPRAVLTSACDPSTGRCQSWLPIAEVRSDDYQFEQDPEYNRAQNIHARGVDEAMLWRDVPAYATEVEARSAVSGNQVQNAGGRLAKKDGFTSRSWGAGGMPFSVLYMSPRPNHQPQTSSAQVEKSADSARRSGDSGRANQSNYRVATRNGGYSQQRRHYSIIPQLFISYGWGPSGKLVQARSDFEDASGKVSPYTKSR